MAMVAALDVQVTLASGIVYDNCLKILDWTPLEPTALELKYYAPNVGVIMEENLVSGETAELIFIE